jgi:hypothetical protein
VLIRPVGNNPTSQTREKPTAAMQKKQVQKVALAGIGAGPAEFYECN